MGKLVNKAGQMTLAVDVTVSNVVIPDIKGERGNTTFNCCESTEQGGKNIIDISGPISCGGHVVPVSNFRISGLGGAKFSEYFYELIVRRANIFEAPVAPLKI